MHPSRAERAWVALGANLGERRATLEQAVTALGRLPGTRLVARSSWHETEPVGGPPGQPRYLNGVVLLATTLTARELLGRLQELERRHGRRRAHEPRHGPRTLDLDLLAHGDARIDEPGLVLPHPRMEERAFVLGPLAELAPEHVLASGRTVRERLAELRGSDARAAVPQGGASVLLHEPAEAGAWCAAWLARGATLGFVPTMGALHDGHLALVRRAVRENDAVCVSVFVNPLQFDDPRDFERYPRDLERDRRMLSEAGARMVFTGTLAGFFPDELDPASGTLPHERLLDPGPCALGLEGDERPGHFAGVATIVARLFDLVAPTRAYFGAKDFQQTLVVRDLARRRGAPAIVVCETRREASGLARSSRNELLSASDRERAAVLFRALCAARDAWNEGARDAATLSRALALALAREPGLELEYAAVRDPAAWSARAPEGPLQRAVALVAARLGGVRLIDNLALGDAATGALAGGAERDAAAERATADDARELRSRA